VEQEDLEMPIGLYDINSASIGQTYDFIVSTVVLMFLQAERIPAIIRNMQEQTSIGGYNLIVCAMDTEDYPCWTTIFIKSPLFEEVCTCITTCY